MAIQTPQLLPPPLLFVLKRVIASRELFIGLLIFTPCILERYVGRNISSVTGIIEIANLETSQRDSHVPPEPLL